MSRSFGIYVWFALTFLRTKPSFGRLNDSLWDELYNNCGTDVRFYCVQDRLMNYINNTLDTDLHLTEGIYFVKNSNDYRTFTVLSDDLHSGSLVRVSRSVNEPTLSPSNVTSQDESREQKQDEQEEKEFTSFIRTVEKIEDDMSQKENLDDLKNVTSHSEFNKTDSESTRTEADGVVIRSLNKVADIFYDKTAEYLTTHDLRLNLPQTFFEGSQLRVSPKGFDTDGGMLVKLNIVSELPRSEGRNHVVSKFFHKVFKKKMLTSLLALLLIIKLIKIKVMYVLPFLIGVNHAKKLLLKTLLFLFPPLVHLFKLCTYYHAHAAKLHYHHHKVKHHHHHIKVPVPVPVPVPVHKPGHYEPSYPHDDSEHLGPVPSDEYAGVELDHPPSDYYPEHQYGSPSTNGHDYYTRNDVQQHGDELDSWGLKDFYASTESPGVLSAQAQAYSPYAEQNYNKYASRISPQAGTLAHKKSKNPPGWKQKSPNSAAMPSYDPFYSPILQKIDSLFSQLGFNDEGCRERLICSMYKNPVRFSPHSNLLSTELSRDPEELEKPAFMNAAALRFYRYVESARNGQSQKDCLKLYPSCSVKTE